jgi:hypothetical protein
VLLDTCVDGVDGPARHRALERAVSCAATLLADASRAGRRAEVVYPGGRAGHRGDAKGLIRALDLLAAVEGGRVPPATLVEAAGKAPGSAVLLSLGGPAEEARRSAASRGWALAVWDAGSPDFGRYFVRR